MNNIGMMPPRGKKVRRIGPWNFRRKKLKLKTQDCDKLFYIL